VTTALSIGVALLLMTACDWNYSKVCVETGSCSPGIDMILPNGMILPGVEDCPCVRYKVTRTGPDGGVLTEEQ